jgi:hypothetical protein
MMIPPTVLSVSSVVLVSIGVAIYIMYIQQREKSPDKNRTIIKTPRVETPRVETPRVETPRTETPMFPDQPPLVTPSPTEDYSLLKFSFEHRILGDGITPDARTKMTPKSAAEDNYQLTRCQFVNAYSIKWSGRYLVVVQKDGSLKWSIRKEEPSACWEIVPGFCGGDGAQYVMLKSKLNNNYLRVNASTKKLVCVDRPSTENAAQYCWKFQKDDPIRRRCGTFYHPDYQRVVTIPCTIVRDPPEGGSCSDVTPGYMARCCGRHPEDLSCRSVFMREVVGRGLNEAALYIKTRFPNHKIVTCARGDPCNYANPFPLYKADTWVIPFDKRLGTVSAPAYRFI